MQWLFLCSPGEAVKELPLSCIKESPHLQLKPTLHQFALDLWFKSPLLQNLWLNRLHRHPFFFPISLCPFSCKPDSPQSVQNPEVPGSFPGAEALLGPARGQWGSSCPGCWKELGPAGFKQLLQIICVQGEVFWSFLQLPVHRRQHHT